MGPIRAFHTSNVPSSLVHQMPHKSSDYSVERPVNASTRLLAVAFKSSYHNVTNSVYCDKLQV